MLALVLEEVPERWRRLRVLAGEEGPEDAGSERSN